MTSIESALAIAAKTGKRYVATCDRLAPNTCCIVDTLTALIISRGMGFPVAGELADLLSDVDKDPNRARWELVPVFSLSYTLPGGDWQYTYDLTRWHSWGNTLAETARVVCFRKPRTAEAN